MTIGTNILGKSIMTRPKLSRPKRLKIKSKEREALWLLASLGKNKADKLPVSTETLTSLKKKKLVDIDDKNEARITAKGSAVLAYYSSKGRVWTPFKPPKVKSKYKVVGFDLDDTLIPGFDNRNVNVNLMRKVLETLRANNIKTAVLSINTPETVLNRLNQYGLTRLIDYPFYVNKRDGVEEIIKSMRYKPHQILIVGHDVALDYNTIRPADKNIKIVLLTDAFVGDIKKLKEDPNAIIMDRTLQNFITVLKGQQPPEPKVKITPKPYVYEYQPTVKVGTYSYPPKPERIEGDLSDFILLTLRESNKSWDELIHEMSVHHDLMKYSLDDIKRLTPKILGELRQRGEIKITKINDKAYLSLGDKLQEPVDKWRQTIDKWTKSESN